MAGRNKNRFNFVGQMIVLFLSVFAPILSYAESDFLKMTDGASIHYEVAGQGTPLILIHGGEYTDDEKTKGSLSWDPQFQEFSESFKVIRFDIRGFGKSTLVGIHPLSSWKWGENEDRTTSDLVELMNYLNIQNAHICGLSIGSGIAAQLAVFHPEMVNKLILASPWYGHTFPDSPQHWEKLKQVIDKTLLIVGANDTGALLEADYALGQGYSPKTITINDAEHFCNKDQPEQFNKSVLEFLSKKTDTELVAYYPFNGNTNDESGNGNHGIVNGGISYDDGMIGQSVRLNGTDSYIRIPDPSQKFDAQYTLAAWVLTEGKGGNFFSKYSWNATVGRGFSLSSTTESGDNLGFSGSTFFATALFDNYLGSLIFPSYTMPVNKLEYIAAVYDAGNLKLYINGAVVSEKNVQHGATLDNSYDMLIGTYFENNGASVVANRTRRTFSGLVDELRIYNCVLSETEIQELYQQGGGTLSANFSADKTTGNTPLSVQFTDLSNGNPTSWEWDFNNDGTIDSEVQNPIRTYEQPGTYTVSLSISDGTNTDKEIKTDYISVHSDDRNVIYSNDFEKQAGSEWSNTYRDVTPTGNRTFLGQFGNETVSLSLDNLPKHNGVTVSFDLFIIRSWDGNGSWGPEEWSLAINGGETLIYTTFSSHRNQSQSYPDDYPEGNNLHHTGADEIDTLGYGTGVWGDSVYHLSFTFAHTEETLQLDFSGAGLEALANESWGLDNVKVQLGEFKGVGANFTANRITGDAPLTIQFTDLSIGNPTSWKWDFDNDGTIDSKEQNPIWTYQEIGTYTVSLTINAGTERNTKVKKGYITATELLPPYTLHVQQKDNEFPVISWTESDENIAGYNIYLGPEDRLIKLNSNLLTLLSYTDTGYAEDERRYTVTSVDTNGSEITKQSVTLIPVHAALKKETSIKRNIMNHLEYTIENNSAIQVDHVRISVQLNGKTYNKPGEFFIEPNSSQIVSVTVAGEASLPETVNTATTLEIIPNSHEKIEIIRTEEINVSNDMPVLRILTEEINRGDTGKIRFTLENTGYEAIEIVTATDSGAPSDEITLSLTDTQGNLISSLAYHQDTGEYANGKTIARIPAKSTFTSELMEITVPDTSPNKVILQLEIANTYYLLGEADQVTMDVISTREQLSLVDTAYYGKVLAVSPEVSDGSENIQITGQAVERATRLPMANVPLNLIVSVNGFERTYKVFTENDGNFKSTFFPGANESGYYKVRAIHPDLSIRPVQGEFAIQRVMIRPLKIALNIPRSYEQSVKIKADVGGLELHNLQMVYDAADQPDGVLIQGIHITADEPIEKLTSGESANIGFLIWADNTAPDNAELVLKVKSDNNDTLETILIRAQFSEAKPALFFTPNRIETGVALGDSISETIILENKGLADLNHVSLSLVKGDGTPGPDWIHLNSVSDLGNMAVGDKREISISFMPKASEVAEGMYSFYLNIRSSNYPETDILLSVSVSQSGEGNVKFKVSDIYTGTTNQNNETIEGLAGARITVQNEKVLSIQKTLTTDNRGEVQFSNLPTGRYKYRARAINHQEYIGRIWIKPGITLNEDVFLGYNLVTVEWEVTETTIQDKYEIVLSATYETEVPAPVVVAEPTSVTLPEMEPGDVFTGEVKFTNYGLIRAENLQFNFPSDDQNFKYEFLGGGLPESLDAKEFITVPYRITCLQRLTDENIRSASGCLTYSKRLVLLYEFWCVNGQFTKVQTGSYWTTVYGNKCYVAADISWSGISWSGTGGMASGTAPQYKPLKGLICPPDRICRVSDPCCLIPAQEPGASRVNMVRGEYRDDAVDLLLKVPGHILDVKRYYYDNAWHFANQVHNLNILYGTGETTPKYIKSEGVTYRKSDEQGTVFTFDKDKHIFAEQDRYRWKDGLGNWRLYDSQGKLLSYGNRNNLKISLIYDDDGKLTGMADNSEQQVLWYEYNSEGNISAVHDASDRKAEYYYTSGKLRKVTDVSGNETLYAYDANGRLESKTDAAGRTTYISYNDYGYVESITKPDGTGKFFDYAYDEGKKEFYASATYPTGKIKETWYDRKGRIIRTDINGKTIESRSYDGRSEIITDVNGNETYRERDEWNNVKKEIFPDGSTVSYKYESKFNNRSRKTDENGVVTRYEYDSSGNLTKIIRAPGTLNEQITEYSYDGNGNQLTEKTVGDDHTAEAVTIMTYDESGNMLSVTDPEGNTTRYTYNLMGQVLTKTDPLGKAWTYAYDNMGNLISATDPLGNLSQYFYDGVGNRIKYIDPAGKTTTYEYNHENKLVKTTDTLGNFTTYQYDADGRIIKKTDPGGKQIISEYDPDGRLVKKIDGEGNEIIYEYADTSGASCPTCSGRRYQPAKITFPTTLIREYQYDTRGRKTEEKDILSEDNQYMTKFQYDAVGNLVSQTDKEGRTTFYEYDQLRRKIKETDALGQSTEYAYDDQGNLITIKDARGNTTQFQYDRNNNLIKEICPMGQVITYQYDKAGNLAKKTDPKNQKIEYSYDDAGRMTSVKYFSASDHNTPVKSITFSYNVVGLLTSHSDGTISGTYTYDDLHRKISETVNYGPFELTCSYSYYKNNMKKSFTGPDGITYEYSYNNNNQFAGVAIPGKGNITYDAYNWIKPETVTLPGGTKRKYLHDPLMRITGITLKDPVQNILSDYQYAYDKMNHILTKKTEHGDYIYKYDSLHRLAKADHPTLTDEAYAYDAVGNRITDGAVTGTWNYNKNNALTGFDNVSLAYDDNGNMIRKTESGETLNYIYDMENRLIRVEKSDGTVIAGYGYDTFGRRIWKKADGVKTFFLNTDEGIIGEYDETGNVIRTYCYKPNSVWTTDPLFMKQGDAYYFYQNDHIGTPILMTDMKGKVVWSARYKVFGDAVVDASSTITNNLRLPGQYYDAETGLHYNYFRTYDPETGRYIQADPLGMGNRPDYGRYMVGSVCPIGYNDADINLYLYANGNPMAYVDPFGTLTMGGSLGVCMPLPPIPPPLGFMVSVSGKITTCCDCAKGGMKWIFEVGVCLGVCTLPSGVSASGSASQSLTSLCCPPGGDGKLSGRIFLECHAPGVKCEVSVTIPGGKPKFSCSRSFDIVSVGMDTEGTASVNISTPSGPGCSGGGCLSYAQ